MRRTVITYTQSYVEEHMAWLESKYPTLSLENRIVIAAQMAHSSVTDGLNQSINSLRLEAGDIREHLCAIEVEMGAVVTAIRDHLP
jgi:hypothetical protein